MKSKVLILGDVMLDRYLITSAERISPEGDFPLLALERTDDRLGGAVNVALNIKALGLDPLIVGVIGNDAEGVILKRLCEAEFSNTQLITVENRPTTTKTRITNQDYGQYLRLDNEDASPLPLEIETILLERCRTICSEETVAAIIIQDYNKGVLSSRLITAVRTLSAEQNLSLISDPKVDNFRALSLSDVFKPNLKELSTAFGSEINPSEEAVSNAIVKLGLSERRKIFVTLGSAGIFYWDRVSGEKGVVAGRAVVNPDVSGAGDTVLAVMTLCILRNMDLVATAELANEAGARVCEKAGVSVISLAELNLA